MSDYNRQDFGPKDSYRHYRKLYPESDISWKMYYVIIGRINQRIADLCLETGKPYYFGYHLGVLKVRKIKRVNFKKKTVDFFTTKKLRAQGISKTAYFVDDYYFRWSWIKKSCNVRNSTAYRFVPSRGKKGLKEKLTRMLKTDEFAASRYEYVEPHYKES